jgi:predicted Zn-dependent peptidase
MCREEAALNALLPAVLLRGCQSAPDLRRITLKLDDLYGASVGALVRRVGDIQTTGLSCGFMDDRFALQGDQILAPMMDFIRQLLLEPLTENGVFCADIVESEKKNLISTLESQRNDKRAYAGSQLLKHLCREDSYGIPRLGEIESVKRITPESLYEHYQKLLKESPVHLFYVGSAPAEKMADLLRPIFTGCACNPISLPAQTGLKPVEYSEHEEALPVTQGKLCMGYTSPINLRDDRYAAVQVANTVLGAGMTSKLFMQVREKMSLCYDIGSAFHGSKGIMTVTAGIEFHQKETVLAEVKQEMPYLKLIYPCCLLQDITIFI